MEKAVVAMEYGADAIYLAGKGFGMRAKAGNFSPEELKEVLALARERGVKVYVTVNTYPRNEEMDQLPAYLEELAELQVDALIIADVGALALARQYAPGLPLHWSAQANTVNYQAAKCWPELGVTRLGRKLGGLVVHGVGLGAQMQGK